MPTYQYEEVLPNGEGGEQFEIFQKMADAPLTVHPETGKPIRRVYLAPAVGGKWSEESMGKAAHDDRKLERLGFTKYVKSDDGKYEKVVGKGPDLLDRSKLPEE
jgi:predicted nucleic acid-binding Zn ribbon protein